MWTQSLWCLILWITFHTTSILASENLVTGEPRVFCGPEGIHVLIRTRDPFRGRLFVQDESERSECLHSYVDGEGNIGGSKPPIDHTAEFHLKFGSCNMRRQRTLNPRGVTFSFTLVVSFHALFLTGADRAFNVRCFFVEAVKAVDAALDVSPLVTEVVEEEFPLPRCTYNLRQGNSGPNLRFANIGEPVTHVWECDPPAGWVYGVLIHSCYVDDGRGNRFELINGRGCASDRVLLGDLTYDERGIRAFVNSHVFKYADRVQLFFTCTIQLCFRQDGGCEGITPPVCRHDTTLLKPPHPRLPSRIDGDLPRAASRSSTQIQRPRIPPSLGSRLPVDVFRQIARNRAFSTPPRQHGEYDRLLKDEAPVNETYVEIPSTTTLFDKPETLTTTNFMDKTPSAAKRSSRDALNHMESDLSAELTVLPLEEQRKESATATTESTMTTEEFVKELSFRCINGCNDSIGNLPSVAAATSNTVPVVCLSRVSAFALATIGTLSVIISAVASAFCVLRRRGGAHFVTRKIFLTD
ncbi:ZP domain-containing protein [Aphelenchoides besseyi]|nr:ZP domain-containing protein [Aphelenchoides besseyi]KAI6202183.1 ZP domain-containing protein [Aphelenchoides besseyi]